MTPSGSANGPTSDPGRRPEPPFSVELLGDLHAGVLPDEVASHVRSRLADDPDARDILAALDRTQADLRSAPVVPLPVPDSVRAATERTLAQIAADRPRTDGPHTDETVTPLSSHPRRRLWVGGGLVAAAAAVIAVLVLSVSVWRPSSTGTPPVQAQSEQPDQSEQSEAPSSIPTLPGGTGPGERVTMLSVLGRTDSAPFGSETALRRCTAANGVGAETPVLGSGPITLRGSPAVVILLGTGVAGRFTALVVGPECDAGTPAPITRAVIGG